MLEVFFPLLPTNGDSKAIFLRVGLGDGLSDIIANAICNQLLCIFKEGMECDLKNAKCSIF
jgi:hypothetical protein